MRRDLPDVPRADCVTPPAIVPNSSGAGINSRPRAVHRAGVNRKRSYVRRGLGLMAGFAPVALLLASLVSALTGADEQRRAGLVVTLLALALGGVNFYLAFLRESLYARSKESLDDYRRVSVIPVVGTLMVMAGAVVGSGSALCAALGLLAVVLDAGGIPWFVVFTWKDTTLWDRPS